MEPLNPHLLAAISLTGGFAWAMVVLGRSSRMLERPAERRCPSCGRFLGRRKTCPCTG